MCGLDVIIQSTFLFNRYNQHNLYNMNDQYNPYTANNYRYSEEGDLIIAESKEKNTSFKILKGIIIEGIRHTYTWGDIVTVRRLEDEQMYTIPTKLIIVHIPSIYYRFDEFMSEILSMSSDDGKYYERLYNIYKTTDNAKYYIGDYVDANGPCLVTKLDVDSKGKLYYEATNIEGNTIKLYESDIKATSTYNDYQQARREYEISCNKKLEEQYDASNVNIPDSVTSLCDSEVEIINDGVSNKAVDNVSYNTFDSLEDKHNKTKKLLKLGIALLLGGI